MRKTILAVLLLTATTAFFVGRSEAQAPKAAAPKVATPAKAAPAAPAAAKAKAPAVTQANLGQLMKGIMYINANVIFAAQGTDPAKYPPAKDPSVSPDALSSTYGKWEA